MPVLHQITHPHYLIQEKVNFFANYFDFVRQHIGELDDLPLENPLSIIDKIIFQIENNLSNSTPYINAYLIQPSLNPNEFLNEFSSSKEFNLKVKAYKKVKLSKATQWIRDNDDFINTIKKIQKELSEKMVGKALGSIISYLRCKHQLNEHKENLKFCTRIIVSEFFIKGERDKRIFNIFNNIISSEINKFPIPKNIKTKNGKENFIKNRSFNQQFEGILTILNGKKSKAHFIFRIFGFKTNDDFEFKYDGVTFLNNKHFKLNEVTKVALKDIGGNDFFSTENFLVAIVTMEYYAVKFVINDAVNKIKDALKYLNLILSANGVIEPYHCLITTNFKKVGFSLGLKSKGTKIDKYDMERLNDNPNRFLNNCKPNSKKHLLFCEPLFVNASSTKSISDYWHYLEVLIPKKENDDKKIREVVSHVLLLSAFEYNNFKLRDNLKILISPYSARADQLGISEDRQQEILRNFENIDLSKIDKEIKHPFCSDYIQFVLEKYDTNRFKALQSYYNSLLLETYSQRNLFIHQGLEQDKSIAKLKIALPILIGRFRRQLFKGIRNNGHLDFNNIIEELVLEGKKLCQAN